MILTTICHKLTENFFVHSYSQAKECNAVKHCIQTEWENAKFPEDNDSVCQVCKDMVKQARDQLLSNETQVSTFFLFPRVLHFSCTKF